MAGGPSTPVSPPPAFNLPMAHVQAGMVFPEPSQAQFQQTLWAYVQTLIEAQTALTAAELPAGTFAGQQGIVTDSSVAGAGNFGAAVVGGGANVVPVYWDSSSWRIG